MTSTNSKPRSVTGNDWVFVAGVERAEKPEGQVTT